MILHGLKSKNGLLDSYYCGAEDLPQRSRSESFFYNYKWSGS
jgi:hypothetical protein